MSTPDYDEFLDSDDMQDQQPSGPRQLRDAMRRAQEQAHEATAKLEAAERRAVFAEAGLINLTPAQRTLLTKGYEGEMTPEAIRTFATEAGFLAPPPAPEPDASAQAQGRIADAGTAGTASPSEDARIAELYATEGKGRDALIAKIIEHGGHVNTE